MFSHPIDPCEICHCLVSNLSGWSTTEFVGIHSTACLIWDTHWTIKQRHTAETCTNPNLNPNTHVTATLLLKGLTVTLPVSSHLQSGLVDCEKKVCPAVECTHPSPGTCCPHCQQCQYMGHRYNDAQVFYTDPCNECTCQVIVFPCRSRTWCSLQLLMQSYQAP